MTMTPETPSAAHPAARFRNASRRYPRAPLGTSSRRTSIKNGGQALEALMVSLLAPQSLLARRIVPPMAPIPDHTLGGIIPPFVGASTVARNCSPWKATTAEVASRFGNTDERRRLL